jgi:hypothetical protein
LKPSDRPITRAKVPRNCSLSSTIETVIGMLNLRLAAPAATHADF